ncbi:MAG: cysteine desulfurase [Deltaproteobacteria bacterium]|nr:cysteine desulfurase [Deltaproteobacteria bacterium]
MSRLDVGRVRKDFPVLEREVHGKPLAYLDNAATSQKPRAVIDALIHYYSSYNANIHRGVHSLSEEATVAYEAARDKVRDFIRAPSSEEIVFTRGTTEAINLVAQSYLRPRIREGDEILISQMEHHSNIVPWQLVREQTGAVLKVAPINERGEIELEQFSKLLGPRTRFVALAHVSNALGTINMVQEMVRLARMRGVPVLLDGAQAVPHLPVDVQELGCDFYAFSGHKMYAPTGIGALYGRRELLEEMEPYQGGGEMILSVTFEKTTYNRVPYKFEAGTPNIAGAIGLGTAIDYLLGLDLQAVRAHEDEVLEYATKEVSKVPSVRLIGTAASKTGVLSFLLGEIHAHDVGTVLDQEGIAVRTGHHCAQPVMDRFGVTATARASFAVYNTTEEVDRLVEGLHRTLEIFS